MEVIYLWSGAILIAFLCGIFVSYLWVKRKYKKYWLRKNKKTNLNSCFSDDIWGLIVDTCLNDFRIQAVGGADSDLFDLIENPVLLDTKYIEESPLLPGEVTLVLTKIDDDFINNWKAKSGLVENAVEKIIYHKKVLYLILYNDFIGCLSILDKSNNVYILYLKTPGHLHMIILNKELNDVIAVAPGIEELHKDHQLYEEMQKI